MSALCLNVGSSTIKAAVFDESLNELARTTVETTGDHGADLDSVVATVRAAGASTVVHRIVHGGPGHDGSAVIDDALVAELESLVPLAPLHMPSALQLLGAARRRFSDSKHVACFDTSFHRTIPAARRRYALPARLTGSLVQKYGFHGLSCEHAVAQLTTDQKQRCVIAHLGSGCSVTAVSDGQSVDTTMGFSPAGGVIMGTRPGDVDPGVMLYLFESGYSATDLRHAVIKESGLLALAGSSDMRVLLNDPKAADAVETFCYRVAQQIAAYAVTLGGLNTVVFTGGIGEHQPAVRDRITSALSFLPSFETVVVTADEELVMARQALTV